MNDVNLLSGNVGALSNANRMIGKLPSGYGGIKVLGAQVVQSAAGTCSLNLIDLGTTGTVSGGTIATLGSAVYVANVPKAFTISTAFVSEGHYIGVEELNVGACATVTIVSLSFLTGK